MTLHSVHAHALPLTIRPIIHLLRISTMLILLMALSLVMGYAIHTQFSRIWFSVLQSALCFSLRLCFSNDVCRAPNSWKTTNQRHGFMAGWHWQKFRSGVPTCLYCLNCTKFGQLILRKIIKIVVTQMSDSKAKMHQIRFRLGLSPRPRWGSLQRSPRPPRCI